MPVFTPLNGNGVPTLQGGNGSQPDAATARINQFARLLDNWWEPTIIDTPRNTDADEDQIEDKDKQILQAEFPTVWQDRNASATLRGNATAPVWSSSNEAVCTIAPTGGTITHVANGSAVIQATSPIRTYQKQLSFQTSGPPSTYQYTGNGIPGTVRGEWEARVQAMIASLANQTKVKSLYTYVDESAGIVHRTPNSFMSGMPITGLSPWTSQQLTKIRPHLIHPQVTWTTTHWCLWQIGAQVLFVGPNNEQVKRTVTAIYSLPQPYADQTIQLLDSPVPAYIKPNKILPDNFANYLPHHEFYNPYTDPYTGVVSSINHTTGAEMGGIWVDQFADAYWFQWFGFSMPGGVNGDHPDMFPQILPLRTDLFPFAKSRIPMDSGSVFCIQIGNDLVIQNSFGYRAEIDAQINAWLPGQAMARVDLSSYTSYI